MAANSFVGVCSCVGELFSWSFQENVAWFLLAHRSHLNMFANVISIPV